ncbi:hypothetical protein PHYPO_G00140290 [Pangasianodon hypophthalmus]|uniref:THAP-type domain-containing protein n=1 Tax=Pangasianodon hypophthalmus TaxID=310915 RepID=A0A5N5KD57_PANHP|nr:hypothetical protein PHYPO_G00140290 [Pangasianodon hypophthalmus]
MPECCAEFGCTNLHKKGSNISFHRVPLERPDLLERWLETSAEAFSSTYSLPRTPYSKADHQSKKNTKKKNGARC